MNARVEWLKCSDSVDYFVMNYVMIYNATEKHWTPFSLWPAQIQTLSTMHRERLLVVLKARQLGLSWLSLAYCLHTLLFQAPSTILLFSLKESEAIELLTRLHGMYNRLPYFLRARSIIRDSAKNLELSNGSRSLAFSTKGGRSYTGSIALVDEADFVPDLGLFLNAVKPTIDGGGKLLLVSTSDKTRPLSTFKNIYQAAVAGVGDYRHIFLPWSAHPLRDNLWHIRTKAEMYAQRGTHDDFYAEYPATPEEALAPEQFDRRIPLDWIKPCMADALPLDLPDAPAIPQLTLYAAPAYGARYVIGADPAEGNPNSDDSAATVLSSSTWEEVASLTGKFEPTVFAGYLDAVAAYYNHADILAERNNHGHSLIAALHDTGQHRILPGFDDKPGWLSNVKGKVLLYDHCADAIRDRSVTIRTPETVNQLASIESSTLRAPEGMHDDRADSFALAVAALYNPRHSAQPSAAVIPHDPLSGVDKDDW